MFLVLHGQTEWNRDGKLQGSHDSNLTEHGRSQALQAARILKANLPELSAARLVASPQGRAQTTAQILASELGLREFETDARLRELSLGAWEGLTRAEIAGRWPERMAGGVHNSWFFRSPGGEEFETISARLHSWLDEQSAHGGLIVVSHGIASRVLRGLYRELPLEEVCGLDVARDAPHQLWNGRDVRLAMP